MSEKLIEYSYRSTPRSQVNGKIYTLTEYPADQLIPLHNEMAYSRNWPIKIWFCCIGAAEKGGETPISDSIKVFQRINPKIKEKFIEKKNKEIYQQEAILFPWKEGDILMLDNMLICHGRQPFVGKRKVVVGMAEPFCA